MNKIYEWLQRLKNTHLSNTHKLWVRQKQVLKQNDLKILQKHRFLYLAKSSYNYPQKGFHAQWKKLIPKLVSLPGYQKTNKLQKKGRV